MNKFDIHFTDEELAVLGSTVGSTWDNYGSSTLSDDGRFAFEDCFVQTSIGTVTLSSSLIEVPLPTGVEEITQLSFRAGSDDTRKSSKRGLQFFQHKGERIDSVSIVQAKVSIFQADREIFALYSDHGIIFHLAGGTIALTRGSWFLEDILVEEFGYFDGATIDDRAIDWDSDLTTEYRVDHKICGLSDLLN